MAMPEISKTSVCASTSKRLLRIAWPFFVVVVAVVLLATESLRIVSAARAYVGGESLWSKAQKEAVYSLFRYAQTRSESDYRDYAMPSRCRLATARRGSSSRSPSPTLQLPREGFLVGQNDPADIDGMVMLFRRFREVSFMSRAIAIWSKADEYIAELDALGQELHGRIVARDTQPSNLEPILSRIDEVNRRLTPLEVGFSTTLGDAARRTQTILEVALVVAAAILVVAGVVVSARIVRRSEQAEAELYAEHHRAQVTLQSIADRVGVSRMTVSNAFSRPDQLSAELRERILSAADELGYVGPDPAARALARGRTGSIGLLLTDELPQAFEDVVATEFLSSEWIRRLQDLTKQARRAGRVVALVGVQPSVRKSADLLAAINDLQLVETIDEVWKIP